MKQLPQTVYSMVWRAPHHHPYSKPFLLFFLPPALSHSLSLFLRLSVSISHSSMFALPKLATALKKIGQKTVFYPSYYNMTTSFFKQRVRFTYNFIAHDASEMQSHRRNR